MHRTRSFFKKKNQIYLANACVTGGQYALIIATMTSFIASKDLMATDFRRSMGKIHKFLQLQHVPQEAIDRVSSYFRILEAR
jgi:hypothetical protein